MNCLSDILLICANMYNTSHYTNAIIRHSMIHSANTHMRECERMDNPEALNKCVTDAEAMRARAEMIGRCESALEPTLTCEKIMPKVSYSGSHALAQIETKISECVASNNTRDRDVHSLLLQHADAVREHVIIPDMHVKQ